MFYHQHLLDALREKEEEFRIFERKNNSGKRIYKAFLERFSKLSLEEFQRSIPPFPKAIGAMPTKELDLYKSLVIPFEQTFHNHQGAREWAKEILEGIPTFAVDGSQLLPSKEFSVPVAVVQIGWFLNPHTPKKPYEKNLKIEILSPDELFESGSENNLFHEQSISLKRYEMETGRLERLFKEEEGKYPKAYAFFDGSLVISFAETLMQQYRDRYLEAAKNLLNTSLETENPLIGYIDTSMARDLIKMLHVTLIEQEIKKFERDPEHHLEELPTINGTDLEQLGKKNIYDATILEELLPNWGDRTIAFSLDRSGILEQYQDAGDGIAFFYMRTRMNRPPSRIEFPMWLYYAGMIEDLAEIIRAELVIGNGYPYVLETADQLAWFSPQDRSKFIHTLEAFLKEKGLELFTSGKLLSKRKRRQ